MQIAPIEQIYRHLWKRKGDVYALLWDLQRYTAAAMHVSQHQPCTSINITFWLPMTLSNPIFSLLDSQPLPSATFQQCIYSIFADMCTGSLGLLLMQVVLLTDF